MNTAWLKQHWYYIAAAMVGVFVLYELAKAASGSSSGGSTSVSGSSDQLASLSAAANIQDAQYNAQVTTASYSASVANNQTAAALQLGEVQTAAQLASTNNQTEAAREVALAHESGLIESQRIVTAGQVQQTQIEGTTLENLAITKASIPLAEIANVGKQIANIQQYSKHASQDYAAIAPVLAEETGQGSSVGAAKPTPGSTTAQNIGAISSGLSTILTGLFG